MKTAEEKAIDFMMELEGNSNIVIQEHDHDNVKQGIILLLKHQDRDTRRACVEAIQNCDGIGGKLYFIDAEDACLNAKAL